METLITMLAPHIRKWIFGICLSWIAIIVEWAKVNNIPITEAVVENWIEILIAILFMVVSAFYTWAKNKMTKQVPVNVPKIIVPEVKALVASSKNK